MKRLSGRDVTCGLNRQPRPALTVMCARGARPECRFHTVWNRQPATSHASGRPRNANAPEGLRCAGSGAFRSQSGAGDQKREPRGHLLDRASPPSFDKAWPARGSRARAAPPRWLRPPSRIAQQLERKGEGASATQGVTSLWRSPGRRSRCSCCSGRRRTCGQCPCRTRRTHCAGAPSGPWTGRSS